MATICRLKGDEDRIKREIDKRRRRLDGDPLSLLIRSQFEAFTLRVATMIETFGIIQYLEKNGEILP